MDSKPFPFECVSVAGKDALAQWHRLNKEWSADGCTAVVLGNRKQLERWQALQPENAAEFEKTLRLSESLTAADILRGRKNADEEHYAGLELGTWPAEPEILTPSSHLTHGGTPRPEVFIAKIPTGKPFEIPAYLNFGGWNDCPDAAEQVAVLRDWSQHYDFRIFAMTGDVLECLVLRPPADRESAIKLATEQFYFCSDLVFQGTQTLLPLAASLQKSPCWYFWWD